MEQAFMLGLVGLTSLGAFVGGVRGLGASPRSLGAAVHRMLEAIGLVLLFLALNVGAGVLIVLSLRALTDVFVSVYVMGDLTWLALSLLQGLAFQWWRASA
jgi:hypothetical protein